MAEGVFKEVITAGVPEVPVAEVPDVTDATETWIRGVAGESDRDGVVIRDKGDAFSLGADRKDPLLLDSRPIRSGSRLSDMLRSIEEPTCVL